MGRFVTYYIIYQSVYKKRLTKMVGRSISVEFKRTTFLIKRICARIIAQLEIGQSLEFTCCTTAQVIFSSFNPRFDTQHI